MGVQAKTFQSSNIWLFVIIAAAITVYQLFFADGNFDLFNADQQADDFIHNTLTDEELVYTHHAKCRMDCRYIDKQEVEYILANGKVNWNKSDKNDTPCPSYSLEGKTKDNQQVRVVFADCQNATKVITVIDLKNDYHCICD